jgi:hypothetical protein
MPRHRITDGSFHHVKPDSDKSGIFQKKWGLHLAAVTYENA